MRRPPPQLGVSLAGVGVALATFGVLIWSADYLLSGGGGVFGTGGGGGDGSRRLLGVALSLAVVAVGYALAIMRRSGPLTTAGVAASALGVPVLLVFLTWDTTGGSSGLPFSVDAVVLVSVLVWLISYLLVPGSRGHAFYLALAAFELWAYLADKAAPGLSSFATGFVGDIGGTSNGPLPSPSGPDWTSLAAVSLAFGLGYYVIGWLLDRSGRTGAAVAFAVAGFPAVAVGIAAAADSLHQIGAGVLLIVIGVAIGAYGARAGRRFTTWIWSLGVAVGIVAIIAKIVPDNTAAAGITFIVIGAVVVAGGHVVSRVLNEPDELVPSGSALPHVGA